MAIETQTVLRLMAQWGDSKLNDAILELLLKLCLDEHQDMLSLSKSNVIFGILLECIENSVAGLRDKVELIHPTTIRSTDLADKEALRRWYQGGRRGPKPCNRVHVMGSVLEYLAYKEPLAIAALAIAALLAPCSWRSGTGVLGLV
ncbi:unnamed protein product [Amoebophrya sp. A120]|nr:unnamed protein product [Amoebophrya sp. A120]|eukprot:GSA120T00022492001.1